MSWLHRIQHWFAEVTGSRPPALQHDPRRRLVPTLSVTQLEPRLVLNGDGALEALVIDAGQAAGDGDADVFDVQLRQEGVEVSVNGRPSYRVDASASQPITLRGSSDDDTFHVRVETPNAVDLRIEGGGGQDAVMLSGQMPVDRLLHVLRPPAEGQVTLQSSQAEASLQYQSVEFVGHQLTADELEVRLGQDQTHVAVSQPEADPHNARIEIDVWAKSSPQDQTTPTQTLQFLLPKQRFRLETIGETDGNTNRVELAEVHTTGDADWFLIGDQADELTFRGHTALGSGGLHARAGEIDFRGSVGGTHARLHAEASQSITLHAESVVNVEEGTATFAAPTIRAEGQMHVRGGSLSLDSGPQGSTVVGGVFDVSDLRAGGSGGDVRVLGHFVQLQSPALIEASGDVAGGSVLIGGAARGGDPAIRNATHTRFEASARVQADARREGAGGTVIVWADHTTRFSGTITARGGRLGGEGGFVEVSGKRFLDYRGHVDTSAAAGPSGTLLLDPDFIWITADSTDTSTVAENDAFGDPGATNAIYVQTLIATLDTANVLLQANTDIVVATAIDALGNAGDFGLTLQAGRSILIQDDVRLRGAFTAIANDGGAAAGRDAGDGEFRMAAGTVIDTSLNDADVSITVSDGFTTGGKGSGDILLETIAAGAGNVTVANRGQNDGSDVLATDTASIRADHVALEVTDTVNNPSGGIATSGNPIDVSANTLSATAPGGGLSLTSSGSLRLQNVDSQGAVQIAAVGGDLVLEDHAVTAGAASVTLRAADGAILEASATTADKITTGGTVTLDAGLGIGSGSDAAALDIEASQLAARTSTSGGVNVSDPTALTIVAAGGIDGVAAAPGGDVWLSAADNLEITPASTVIGGGDATSVTLIAGALQLGDGAAGVETVRNSGTGTLSLTTLLGDALLGDHAIASAGGQIDLVSAGGIDEVNESDLVNLTSSGRVRLQAETGIGQTGGAWAAGSGPLDVQIAQLIASVNASGGVHLKEADGLILEDVDTAAGAVEIRGGGTLEVRDVDAAGSVTLVADAGDLELADGAIQASAGDVVLGALAGAVRELTPNQTAKVVAGGALAISAQDDVGAAATDASIDVQVATLAAETTGTGSLYLNALADLAVGSAPGGLAGLTTAGSGAIVLTASGSSLTADETILADGDLTLQAFDLTFNAGVRGTNVDLEAAGSLVAASGVRVLGGGGGTTVNVQTANLLLPVGNAGNETIVNAGSGAITVTVLGGDLNLPTHGLRSDTGQITLSASAGGILEAVAGTEIEVATEGVLTLLAAGPIGSLLVDGALDTQVAALAAETTGNHAIVISEADGLVVTGGNGTNGVVTNDAPISLRSGSGTLQIDQAIAAGSGPVEWRGQGVTLAAEVRGGAIDLIAGASFTQNPGGSLVATGTNTTLALTAADVQLTDGAPGNASVRHIGGGDVTVQSDANVTLDEHAIASNSGNVTVTSVSGAILSVASGSAPLVTAAGTATFSADTGIGSAADPIVIAASGLAGRSASSGGLFVTDSDGLVIGVGDGGVSGLTTAGGPIRATVGSGLLRTAATVNAADGLVQLSGGAVEIDSLVQGFEIEVNASGLASFQPLSRLIGGGSGSVVAVDAGAITVGAGAAAAGTITNSGTGTISLTSNGGAITLDAFALQASSGSIEVNADTASVQVVDMAAAAEISTAGRVIVSAAAVGDSSHVLELDGATELSFTDTGGGDAFFAELTASTITATELIVGNLGYGAIGLDYFNTDRIDIQDDHRIAAVRHGEANRAFSYRALAGDVRLADAAIEAGSGTVTLQASAGSLQELNANTSTNITTTGTLTLSGTQDLGTATASGHLDIDAGLLAATSSAGAIHLRSPGDLRVGFGAIGAGGVSTSGGAISLLVAGHFQSDRQLDSSGGSIGVSAASAQVAADVRGGDVTMTITNALTVTAGNQVVGGGDGTTVILEAATIELQGGSDGAETVRNRDSGEVLVRSGGGTLTLEADALASVSGAITIDLAGGSLLTTPAGAAPHLRTAAALAVTAAAVGDATNPLSLQGATALRLVDAGAGDSFFAEVGGSSLALLDFEVPATGLGGIEADLGSSDQVTIASGHAISLVRTDGFDRSFRYHAGSGTLTLGQIDTGNADLSLTTLNGSILESTPDQTFDVSTAGTVTLSATAGIGAAGVDQSLDLNVGVVAARTSAGGLFFRQSGDLMVGAGADGVTGLTAPGAIVLDASSQNVTVNQAIDSSADRVSLTMADLDVNADLRARGDLQLLASGAVRVQNGQRVVAGGDGTNLQIQAASIFVGSGSAAAATVENGGLGAVSLTASSGSVSVGSYAIEGGSADLLIQAATNLDVLESSNAGEISTTGTVELTARSIGDAVRRLDLAGPIALTLNDTGVGDSYLREADAATIGALVLNLGGANVGALQIEYSNSDRVDIGDGHLVNRIDHQAANRSLRYVADAGTISIGSGGIDTGAAPLTLVATAGSIVETPEGSAPRLSTQQSLTLSAATGIGSPTATGRLDVRAPTLAAEATVSGGVFLFNHQGMAIGTADLGLAGVTAAGGDVWVAAAGDLTVLRDVSGENLTLESTGQLTVVAGNQVRAGGDATALSMTAGELDLGAGTASTPTVFNQGSGTITLSANAGTLRLSGHAVAAETGALHLDAGAGQVTLIKLPLAPEVVTAGAVTVTAASVGAAGQPLDLSGAASLNVFDRGPGAIHLREFGAVSIAATAITSHGLGVGTIDLQYANADLIDIDQDHRISRVRHGDADRAFEYEALAGNIMLVDESIHTATATVWVKASGGAIVDVSGSATPKIRTGGTLTLSARAGVGGAAAGHAIDLEVGTVAATTTHAGGVFLQAASDATVGTGANGIVGVTSPLGGQISISAPSDLLRIHAPIESPSGTVELHGNGIELDSRVRGGTITMTASTSASISNGARMVATADGGLLRIDAAQVAVGSGTVSQATLEHTALGAIELSAPGGLQLEHHAVESGDASLGIEVGAGSIDVLRPAGTAEIRSGGAVVISAASVGTPINPLEITGAEQLVLHDAGAGEMHLAELGGASITSLGISVPQLNAGAIRLAYDNGDRVVIEDNHGLQRVDHSRGNRSFDYDGGGGSIWVGAIDVGAGAVTLRATAGAIRDATADSLIDIVAGGNLTLDAWGGIGDVSLDGALETQAANLAARSTAFGGVFIAEQDAVNIGSGADGITGIRTAADGPIVLSNQLGVMRIEQFVDAGRGDLMIDVDRLEINAPLRGGDVDVQAATSFALASGQPIMAGGDGTTLSITAPQIRLPDGISRNPALLNFGSGRVLLTATGGDVTLGHHSVLNGTGGITINAPAGSIQESLATDVRNLATSGVLTLNSAGAIGRSFAGAGPNGHLDVLAPAFFAQTSGTGGVYVDNESSVSLLGVEVASGGIELHSDVGLVAQQPVRTLAGGDVALTAEAIWVLDAVDVTALGGNVRLAAAQPGGIFFGDDALLITGQGQVSGRLFNAPDPFAGSSSVGSSLSDTNRQAVLRLLLQDDRAINTRVEVDWDEGESRFPVPLVPPQDLRARVIQAEMPSGGAGIEVAHEYEEAPDPTNPSADIRVRLRLVALASGTIQVTSGAESLLAAPRFRTQTIVIDVSAPIFPFFIRLPQDEAVETVAAPAPVIIPSVDLERVFTAETNADVTSSIGTTQQSTSRYYVLRIVSFGDEGEVRLTQDGREYRLRDLEDPDSERGFELNQLPQLFQRLPDDRYRIYLIEGSTERLVLDFIIRDGQPVEAGADGVSAESAREPVQETQPPGPQGMGLREDVPQPGTEDRDAAESGESRAGEDAPEAVSQVGRGRRDPLPPSPPPFSSLGAPLGEASVVSVGGWLLTKRMFSARHEEAGRRTSASPPRLARLRGNHGVNQR